MDLNCPHFKQCSGCSRDIDIEKPTSLQAAERFFSTHGITPLPFHVGAIKGWRCRAKLATRGSSAEPLVGLFKEGSHEVLDIPFCQVHHPLINQAANILRQWISINAIALYDEKQGSGFLRYVQFAVERTTQRVQLVLVVNLKQEAWKVNHHVSEIEKLWKMAPELWHSLWLNFNPKRDNVIFSPRWERLYGEEWLWEQLGGRDVCFHPASFAQANLEMFDKLLTKIQSLIIPEAHVVEFYAGVGGIALSIAAVCRRVLCIEIVPTAQICFQMALQRLPKELADRLTFCTGSADVYGKLWRDTADVAIVDPPRKGLDAALLKDLCQPSSLKRLIYVSCGWESFQHDCQLLIAAGWHLSEAEAYLFFPGSEHLETLAIFERFRHAEDL